MDTKLIKILEDIQDNMSCGYCYPRKIISRYYIHNNLIFTIRDNIFYYGDNYNKYYYFYIWLMMYGVL